MLKLKFLTCNALGNHLYGIDEDGSVWLKRDDRVWKEISMETDGCPLCHRRKDDPKLIVEADGHGGLAKYCSDKFHN